MNMSDEKFSYKFGNIQIEFQNAPLLLRIIALDFIAASNAMGIEPIITRILEPIEGESGVHRWHRAIDFRDEFNGLLTYNLKQASDILTYINTKYARNDKKDTLISHQFKDGPKHFHLQIAESNLAYMPREAFLRLTQKL